MTGRLCLLLLLGAQFTETRLVEVSSTTAKTVYEDNEDKFGSGNAVDSNTATSYTSNDSEPDQWLKLKLKEPTSVGTVGIINS